jgi:hypothetical protein
MSSTIFAAFLKFHSLGGAFGKSELIANRIRKGNSETADLQMSIIAFTSSS